MYTMRPAAVRLPPARRALDEAIALLARASRTTRLLAGGHSLLPVMKLRLARPAALVDIGRDPGARRDRRRRTAALRIGALDDARRGGRLRRRRAAPARCSPEAAALIGDRQVRNRGTIGGSLAHADPGADYPTVMKALGATVATRRGAGGERDDRRRRLLHGHLHDGARAGRARDLGVACRRTGAAPARRT